MREVTVYIRFTRPCLGKCKRDNSGRFYLLRDEADNVMFLATWHHANMKFASQLFGQHQQEISKICWDVVVDAGVVRHSWYRRYYETNGRQRYVIHECLPAGRVVGINCVIPASISDDDFWSLMTLAGRYKGLSPAKPGEFGLFTVDSIRPRRATPAAEEVTGKEAEPGEPQTPQALA